ncbi:hypothetical protein [Anaerotignum sp.]|uniref:hypothetical protein n=1 Tax=Anaerotignum sp. TaxID=2039241 RepID=UPI00271535B3|nr:hypothetical protein [Anaerotignum sp.]
MDESIRQEVNLIVDIMINETKIKIKKVISWKGFFKMIKILVSIIVVLAFVALVANIAIGINSYIKLHGIDLTVVSVIIAFMALNTESASLEKSYYIMYHVKNDKRVPLIITTLQEKVAVSKMSIQFIDIVEHKCHTYLQIKYKK